MGTALFSLTIIMAIAVIGPLVSSLVPGGWLPAGALILLLGAVAGPHMLGLIDPQATGLPLLKELGTAFLFLLGGYELSLRDIVGRTGRHAIASWVFSLVAALVLVTLALHGSSQRAIVAVAIALTGTSYGNVERTLSSRGALDTRFGHVVASYGATGELLPVAAVAVLLSDRAPLVEIAIMAVFALIALGVGSLALHERTAHTRLARFFASESGAAVLPQLVVAILVALVTLGVILGADMIVAGFAAGFILRRLAPSSNSAAFKAVSTGANVFLIPITFVLTGCGINLGEGLSEPLILVGFVTAFVLVRGLPVVLSLRLFPGDTHLSTIQQITVAAYACSAMSGVVAMTNVAVQAGDLTTHIASVLVFASTLVSMVMPLVTRALARRGGGPTTQQDSHPGD